MEEVERDAVTGQASLWVLTGSAHHPVNESASVLREGLHIVTDQGQMCSEYSSSRLTDTGSTGSGLARKLFRA